MKHTILIITASILAFTGCSIGADQDQDQPPLIDQSAPISKANIGKDISVEGWTGHYKNGDGLLLDNGSIVWMDDSFAWPEEYYSGSDKGKKVKVTGTLAEDYGLPVFIPDENEPIVQGMPVPEGTDLEEASHRFLLENATWELIEENSSYDKTLFKSDFDAACNGVPVNGAASYTKTAGIHPIVVFDRENKNEKFINETSKVPEAWEKDWKEAAKTELVACLTITSEEKIDTCDFDIDGDTFTVELYNAEYEAVIYEAKTGIQVASANFELQSGNCPVLKFFSQKVEKEYPDYKQALIDFAKQYVQL